MAYVVAATWRAKEGQAEVILDVIKKMTPPSRQEPGCLFYQAQRSADDPHLFFLYEQYIDQGGYETHMATPHFEKWVRGVAFDALESRERAFYDTIDL